MTNDDLRALVEAASAIERWASFLVSSESSTGLVVEVFNQGLDKTLEVRYVGEFEGAPMIRVLEPGSGILATINKDPRVLRAVFLEV